MNKLQKYIMVCSLYEGRRWEGFKRTVGKATKTAGAGAAGAGVYWAAKNPGELGKKLSKTTNTLSKHATDWAEKVKDGMG